MSLKYFELLDSVKEEEVSKNLLFLFNYDYAFGKLCQTLTAQKYTGIDFSTIVNAFKYFGIKIDYGENIYYKIEKLKLIEKKEDYKRGREPKISPDKELLYLLSVVGPKASKHKVYWHIKKVFCLCDEIEFKWALHVLCKSSKVGGLI